MAGVTAFPGTFERPGSPACRRDTVLRFVTIAIYQGRSGARWQANIRPIFERVTTLDGGRNHARGHKTVNRTDAALAGGSWRQKLGHSTTVGSDHDALTRLDSANITAEVVPQLSDAGF